MGQVAQAQTGAQTGGPKGRRFLSPAAWEYGVRPIRGLKGHDIRPFQGGEIHRERGSQGAALG